MGMEIYWIVRYCLIIHLVVSTFSAIQIFSITDFKKPSKRHLNEESKDENIKRPRTEDSVKNDDDAEPKPKAVKSITKLKSFREFMAKDKLKGLTRHKLEEFCLQKLCESIAYKSEIGELRQKAKMLEIAIDTWRKDAIIVAKQTRDLNVVHERLMADFKQLKEQQNKTLVPVRITRSVGLQAVTDSSILRTKSMLLGNSATLVRNAQQPTPSKGGNVVRQQTVKVFS